MKFRIIHIPFQAAFALALFLQSWSHAIAQEQIRPLGFAERFALRVWVVRIELETGLQGEALFREVDQNFSRFSSTVLLSRPSRPSDVLHLEAARNLAAHLVDHGTPSLAPELERAEFRVNLYNRLLPFLRGPEPLGGDAGRAVGTSAARFAVAASNEGSAEITARASRIGTYRFAIDCFETYRSILSPLIQAAADNGFTRDHLHPLLDSTKSPSEFVIPLLETVRDFSRVPEQVQVVDGLIREQKEFAETIAKDPRYDHDIEGAVVRLAKRLATLGSRRAYFAVRNPQTPELVAVQKLLRSKNGQGLAAVNNLPAFLEDVIWRLERMGQVDASLSASLDMALNGEMPEEAPPSTRPREKTIAMVNQGLLESEGLYNLFENAVPRDLLDGSLTQMTPTAVRGLRAIRNSTEPNLLPKAISKVLDLSPAGGLREGLVVSTLEALAPFEGKDPDIAYFWLDELSRAKNFSEIESMRDQMKTVDLSHEPDPVTVRRPATYRPISQQVAAAPALGKPNGENRILVEGSEIYIAARNGTLDPDLNAEKITGNIRRVRTADGKWYPVRSLYGSEQGMEVGFLENTRELFQALYRSGYKIMIRAPRIGHDNVETELMRMIYQHCQIPEDSRFILYVRTSFHKMSGADHAIALSKVLASNESLARLTPHLILSENRAVEVADADDVQPDLSHKVNEVLNLFGQEELLSWTNFRSPEDVARDLIEVSPEIGESIETVAHILRRDHPNLFKAPVAGEPQLQVKPFQVLKAFALEWYKHDTRQATVESIEVLLPEILHNVTIALKLRPDADEAVSSIVNKLYAENPVQFPESYRRFRKEAADAGAQEQISDAELTRRIRSFLFSDRGPAPTISPDILRLPGIDRAQLIRLEGPLIQVSTHQVAGSLPVRCRRGFGEVETTFYVRLNIRASNILVKANAWRAEDGRPIVLLSSFGDWNRADLENVFRKLVERYLGPSGTPRGWNPKVDGILPQHQARELLLKRPRIAVIELAQVRKSSDAEPYPYLARLKNPFYAHSFGLEGKIISIDETAKREELSTVPEPPAANPEPAAAPAPGPRAPQDSTSHQIAASVLRGKTTKLVAGWILRNWEDVHQAGLDGKIQLNRLSIAELSTVIHHELGSQAPSVQQIDNSLSNIRAQAKSNSTLAELLPATFNAFHFSRARIDTGGSGLIHHRHIPEGGTDTGAFPGGLQKAYEKTAAYFRLARISPPVFLGALDLLPPDIRGSMVSIMKADPTFQTHPNGAFLTALGQVADTDEALASAQQAEEIRAEIEVVEKAFVDELVEGLSLRATAPKMVSGQAKLLLALSVMEAVKIMQTSGATPLQAITLGFQHVFSVPHLQSLGIFFTADVATQVAGRASLVGILKVIPKERLGELSDRLAQKTLPRLISFIGKVGLGVGLVAQNIYQNATTARDVARSLESRRNTNLAYFASEKTFRNALTKDSLVLPALLPTTFTGSVLKAPLSEADLAQFDYVFRTKTKWLAMDRSRSVSYTFRSIQWTDLMASFVILSVSTGVTQSLSPGVGLLLTSGMAGMLESLYQDVRYGVESSDDFERWKQRMAQKRRDVEFYLRPVTEMGDDRGLITPAGMSDEMKRALEEEELFFAQMESELTIRVQLAQAALAQLLNGVHERLRDYFYVTKASDADAQAYIMKKYFPETPAREARFSYSARDHEAERSVREIRATRPEVWLGELHQLLVLSGGGDDEIANSATYRSSLGGLLVSGRKLLWNAEAARDLRMRMRTWTSGPGSMARVFTHLLDDDARLRLVSHEQSGAVTARMPIQMILQDRLNLRRSLEAQVILFHQALQPYVSESREQFIKTMMDSEQELEAH